MSALEFENVMNSTSAKRWTHLSRAGVRKPGRQENSLVKSTREEHSGHADVWHLKRIGCSNQCQCQCECRTAKQLWRKKNRHERPGIRKRHELYKGLEQWGKHNCQKLWGRWRKVTTEMQALRLAQPHSVFFFAARTPRRHRVGEAEFEAGIRKRTSAHKNVLRKLAPKNKTQRRSWWWKGRTSNSARRASGPT